ncbi:D-amino acid dehydrogenase [Altererythrobacter indicus]|uniref:D-amino acid dehydrogenase n=1 Tax=Altericroceibacterium indicum TaxID=374177 RepID=A0A845AA80_9SPHN|nr:D-amino acid dehydrogenase [Altericroceibacterium indicum]MXP26407.1 D-amino acid dehydrogenase [Altericroceibacterium indicum]
MAHIIVLGAGITGVTTAYALLERGHEVTVVEKHRYPAMETSFANGGQLSASNAEVWNNWSTILKGLKWMLRSDAPLLVNPRPNYHKYSWMAEFCGQILHYKPNTVETTRLAIAARQHLFHMAKAENIDFDLEKRGILHLYYNPAALKKAELSNALMVEGGLERYPVTPEEMLSIEPALHGQFAGGFFTPSDCTGDIHKFTSGLAKACEKRGARFVFNAPVNGIIASPDHVKVKVATRPDDPIEGDALVICAGVASRHFAHMLGDRVNIYPVKGYSITVSLDDEVSQNAAPTVSLLDEDAKIVTSRLGRQRFRVAGTAEFNGENKDIRADRIAPLVRWCEKLFPDMCTRDVKPWAGLRPMTPSMLPRVGPGKRPHIFYNTGHGHLGWTLSAATAQLVAEQVDQQTRH